MDNITEKNEAREQKRSILDQLGQKLDEAKAERIGNRRRLAIDLAIFALGFILSRCHLLFGAYPVGLAFVSMLPIGVWPALFGSVTGSLTRGGNGISLAVVTAISAFLRAALSSGGKKRIFSESLLLRMSVALLSGFVSAAYEAMRQGLTESVMLYGLSMIILPPTLTFVFSGIFDTSLTLDSLIFGSGDIFSLSKKDERERYNLIFFQISALLLLFFISLSLGEVSIFGISLSSVFTVIVTLFVAKRFGALRALTTGFITSLGTSGIYSVSFALMGLGAGLMFGFGIGYALITGGVALCAWSIYSSGLVGFLTTFPEFMIASTLSLPMLKRVSIIKPHEVTGVKKSAAEDMVGTMALAYQNRYSGNLSKIPALLSELSSVIREYKSCSHEVLEDVYLRIIDDVSEKFSPKYANEASSNLVYDKNKILGKLLHGDRLTSDDISCDAEFRELSQKIADAINKESLNAEMSLYFRRAKDTSADEYELIAKLISSAEIADEAERSVDNSLTDALTVAIEDVGLCDGVIRVFGERRKHIILAGEDKDGSIITSKELRERLEKIIGVRLDGADYYKSGSLSLMECGIKPRYKVSCATASAPASASEISGDSSLLFETPSERFYAILSDGMGSGDVAKETSELVTRFMRCALLVDASKETVTYMLNNTIRTHREECSATVDLFELDLLNGDGTFIKSGAAPSYIKRDSSIFRIKSQTAPIGLLETIDTEKIRVEVRVGDHIVILSDGISQSSDDAPWLLELLNEPPIKNLKEYANKILTGAIEHSKTKDDMTVVILRIEESNE